MQISNCILLSKLPLDSSNFESLQSVSVVNHAEIRLFLIDDLVTLEYNDRVWLTFPLISFPSYLS